MASCQKERQDAMPIIIVLIAVVLLLLFGPLIKYVEDKQPEKFWMEDMGRGKKKGTEKPEINYSKVMFVLFVLLLISMMTAFIIALVYPPP